MAAPTGNQSIRFHAGGLEAQSALLAIVDGAQRRVLLSTFILGADELGDALVAALVRLARAGVDVCVLLDALARLRRTIQIRSPSHRARGASAPDCQEWPGLRGRQLVRVIGFQL